MAQQLPVETPDNPFVAPVNIETIEVSMNKVDYQGVVDKVSAIYTKNLAQPWQTMFKVFNRCLTTRTYGHYQTKINILQLFHVVINCTNFDYATLLWWDFMNNVKQKKEAIQYPRFIKLIIVDLMKKFPEISKRIEDDYHSIKDDIPLVSVYTTGDVRVRGMLILIVFLTKEICATDDFKEYETVRMKEKKRKQTAKESSSPRQSHKITIKRKKPSTTIIPPPSDDRERDEIAEATLLKEIEKLVEGDEDEESYASEFANSVLNDDVDDFGTSTKIGKEQKQTPIPSPTRSHWNVSSSDKIVFKELTATVSPTTATTSKDSSTTKCKKQSISFRSKTLPGSCPGTTFLKTKEMITQEMPHLVNLAVNKDREVDPIKAKEMIAKEFATHGPKMIKELFRKHMQNTVLNLYPITSTSTVGKSSADL
uniref:Uncharacterized protein n=1 Tax=Tanacetum cinerariifolium TaxID=118510 RepID=A0A6L2MSX6_TANCI|nr:hypothetical protein [Tanacetum cinerariifolium]